MKPYMPPKSSVQTLPALELLQASGQEFNEESDDIFTTSSL